MCIGSEQTASKQSKKEAKNSKKRGRDHDEDDEDLDIDSVLAQYKQQVSRPTTSFLTGSKKPY